MTEITDDDLRRMGFTEKEILASHMIDFWQSIGNNET